MTGLLPFVERMFDVQTDISLLELGDVQHPLLQELVRRAPGTYNHSINVASIAETAADAIGANGLLVRVGAYFHDIGKMLKPSYFVENQGPEGNRHETLQPAMSTLVIIAHVKDGADLARQHHLPQSIIDFIEQHHGTTLVEYFYRREAQRLKDDPDAGELDETTFRYPGPKPQTKEAGVLMLADVVESASRALVDPTPARIESLVHDLAMKRLLDGQFDECGLTLSELHTIEDSPRQEPHRRLSRPREVSRAPDGLNPTPPRITLRHESNFAALGRAKAGPGDQAALDGINGQVFARQAIRGQVLGGGRLLARGATRKELATAVAAFHQPAVMLYGDPQVPAADGAGFVEVRNSRHGR